MKKRSPGRASGSVRPTIILPVRRDEGRDYNILTPEHGPIALYLRSDDAKGMHRALYDKFQVDEDLEVINKRYRIIFKTPFGDFPTMSFHVLSPEDLTRLRSRAPKMVEAARCALYASRRIIERFRRVPERMKFEGLGPGGTDLGGMLQSFLYDAEEQLEALEIVAPKAAGQLRAEHKKLIAILHHAGVRTS